MPAWHGAQGSHLTLGAQGYTCLIFSRSPDTSALRYAAISCLSPCCFLWNLAFLAPTTLPSQPSLRAPPQSGPLLQKTVTSPFDKADPL